LNTLQKYRAAEMQVAVDTPRRTGLAVGMSGFAQPRWSFRRPAMEEVARFLAEQPRGMDPGDFSYAEVGRSRDETVAPAGYNVDHNRQVLGRGEGDFAAACAALRAWRMFPQPWTFITPADRLIRAGEVVAMQAHALGLWWLNACRIVYLIDERGPAPIARCYGFAYGTLSAHVEQGEERFSVELHEDGSVWYDLYAFSRPRCWPVRLFKPLARRLQAKFVGESKAAMQTAVRTQPVPIA
jgi:uncharacterized protein (UPF0548 family)